MKNVQQKASNSNYRIYPDTADAGALEHIARIEENPAISAKMDEQQGADRTWFEAHPQRTLHLRKARAWERLPDDGFANATLVIKIASGVELESPCI